MSEAVLYYADQGEVLRQYRESRKFFQCIMGPLGSGKTFASLQKLMELICSQTPDHKRERRSRWAAVRNCFDDQTEILTELRGWQLFKDLRADDKVAMLDGDELRFVLPTYYYTAPYRGEMVGFENEGVDFLVTPDHKLWVSKAQTRQKVWSPYHLMLAHEAYGQTELRVRRDATWTGVDPGCSVDVFEWLGFWFAEGTIGEYAGGRRFAVTQTKPAGAEYARQLFARAGIAYGEQRRADGFNFAVSLAETNPLGIELFWRLQGAGKATTKAAPSWIKTAPRAHLEAFLKGFIAGDGHVKANGVTTLYTSSRQLADDLQEIALKAGRVTNLSVRDRRGQAMCVNGISTTTTAPEYTLTLLGPAKHTPRLTVGGYAGRYRGWYRQDYDGTVYCVEVPTHVVLVRRNGRAHWSSQTYPDLLNTTIRDFKQVFEPLRVGTMTMGHPPEMKLDFDLPDGTRVRAEVVFIALDKDDDVRKLRGAQLTGAWVNEMKEVPKSIIDMLQARVDRYPKQGASRWVGIFGDTNAWDVDHWLEVIAQGLREGAYADYAIFTQPGAVVKRDGVWTVNPDRENTLFVGDEYYRRLIEGRREDWVKVNLANEIGYYVDGRPVHSDYSDSWHGAKDELHPGPGVVYVGVDYGLTPAVAFAQKQPTGQWWVFDEIVTEDSDATSIALAIKARCSEWDAHLAARKEGAVIAWSFKGDPAGDSRAGTDRRTPGMIVRMNGVPIAAASSNDPVVRRAALDRPLTRTVQGKPGILFSPRCRVLRKGLAGGYHYKRVAVDGGESLYRDVPVKNKYSHVVEALEYALMDAGEHAIVNPVAPAPKPKRPTTMRSTWSPMDV